MHLQIQTLGLAFISVIKQNVRSKQRQTLQITDLGSPRFGLPLISSLLNNHLMCATSGTVEQLSS